MDANGVPPDVALRRAIAGKLVDRLNDRLLAPLAARMPRVEYIDCRGILPNGGMYRDYRANELHPTNLGFRMIFERAWLPVLFKYGIALQPTP